MKNLFQTSAQIQKIMTLVDGGVKLDCITQELSPQEATILFSLKGKQGWFLFQEAPIKKEDIEIPEIEGEFKKDKTPSQMMRNIIYRIWETTTSRKEAFPDYYKSYMFKLNEMLKEKLN